MAKKAEEKTTRFKYTGPTCVEQGYVCDHEEILWTTIKSENDPKTGMIKNATKECIAFYQCRHCGKRLPVASATFPLDTVVTFEDMIEVRRQMFKEQQSKSMSR